MNIRHLIVSAFAFAVLAAVPLSSAHAATVYLESSRTKMAVGDTAVVTVGISSEGAVLNTVEGQVGLKQNASSLSVKEFSLAGSSFGMWPRTPSLSADGRTVSFVGGVPGGFSINGATIFRIVVTATAPGLVHLMPANTVAYANDGKGTRLPVTVKGVDITVTAAAPGSAPADDWSGVVSGDTVPPEPFVIVLGQDPSVFDGKKFAFFSAVDNQSGIDHYDVSEDGRPAVRSGSTYVLSDQSDAVRLNVTAYDKAGNTRVAAYGAARLPFWKAALIILIILVAGYGTYRALRHPRHA